MKHGIKMKIYTYKEILKVGKYDDDLMILCEKSYVPLVFLIFMLV